MMKDVETIITEIVGPSCDPDVLSYVISVVDDDTFEFGDDAADAFEAIGPLLVGGGCAPDDDAAHNLCRQLQKALQLDNNTPTSDDAENNDTDTENTNRKNINHSHNNTNNAESTFRALKGGPILMDDMNRIKLHPSDSFSGKHLIQGVFRECDTDEDFSLMSDKDAAKIKKQKDKAERAQRAAFEAHQNAAAAALRGEDIEVLRNIGGPSIRDIHLTRISVSNGGAELIEDADVVLAYGRKYGLVGRNGTGKSTFLRAFAGRQFDGLPLNCQVLHVAQEIVGDSTTVLQAVLKTDMERTRLLAEEASLMSILDKVSRENTTSTTTSTTTSNMNGDTTTTTTTTNSNSNIDNSNIDAGESINKPSSSSNNEESIPQQKASKEEEDRAVQRLDAISRRLLEIDAYGAEARAASILAGLSFDPDMQRLPTSSLSGGWRMRVALARALFVQPDILLLDEPTNHLDLHAVLWLQDYLEKWPKTVVVVSHAREFLNAVCTDILHLHTRKLIAYKGNYSVFEKTAAERLRNARAASDAVAAKRAHVQAFIDRFRYNANRAALVQSRIKALERMADVAEIESDPEYSFMFPSPPDPVGPPVISFTDVAFSYAKRDGEGEEKGEEGKEGGQGRGGVELYRDLNFGLDMESRFAIVGGNGAGKSTLLNLIAGVLEPTRGHVYRNPKLRMAVFSQHHVDGLDLALTPLQYIAQCFPDAKDPQHRSHLASFGVHAELAAQPMYTLSGGQKSRVALAKVTWSKPHILLLDEPSNHLDMEAVDALIEGLAVFRGGVVMVSHDQHLIEATVDELWAVEERTVKVFHGTFNDYKKRLRMLASSSAKK